MIVASEVLPKCADGSTPHRVPLFVYRDVSGKPKTAFYTEYPAAEAFVDLPRGWVPGPPRARPSRAPDGGTLSWCAPVGPSAIGGLSALQSTDAGKAYHCGIVMLLKLLGQPVPGVPTNTREAKAVLVFVEDLLRTMWRQPDWFVPSPVPPPSSDRAVPAYLPCAPVQVGAVSLRAAVLQRDARRRRAAGRVAQRSWSRPVPSPRRAKDQPRLSATDASPAASPGAPCTPAPSPVRVRLALTARPPV